MFRFIEANSFYWFNFNLFIGSHNLKYPAAGRFNLCTRRHRSDGLLVGEQQNIHIDSQAAFAGIKIGGLLMGELLQSMQH